MAGSHFTGPLKVAGVSSSAAGNNEYLTPIQGAVTSNLTLTGMAVGDVIKGAFRIKFSAALLPTVSNLTSVATAGTNLIKLTGKTTVSSLVLIHWVDVSAAS